MAFDEKCGFLTAKTFVLKVFYFSFVSVTVQKLVYSPLYFKQLGLGASYAGILSGTAPFIRGVGAPFFGYLADKTHKRKFVFLVSVAVQSLSPILLLIPRPDKQICKTARESHISHLGKFGANNTFRRSSDQAPRHSMKHDITQQAHSRYREIIQLNSTHRNIVSPGNVDRNNNDKEKEMWTIFLILMSFTLFGEFFGAPARNLADSALLETLGSESSKYGEYRLWGNVGQAILYATSTLAAKFIHLQQSCDLSIPDDYGMAMYIIALFVVAAFACALQINFNQDSYSEKISLTPKSKEASLKKTVLNFRSITMIIIILFFGIVDGTFLTFMFWYLTDINSSQANWVMGVAGVLRTSAGGITFRFSGKVIRKLGAVNTIHLSLTIYVLAFVLYGLIRDPWLAIVPEVMQAIAFASSMVACILFFTEISPPSLAATMQGIVQSCYQGIGFGVGPIISGFLMENLGGSWTFLVFGGVTMVMVLFSIVTQIPSKCLEKLKETQQNSQPQEYE